MICIGLVFVVSQICCSQTYWSNSIGDFDTYADYTSFAYDQLESLPKPTTTWDTTFNNPTGDLGNIKITFTNQTQGIKITAYSKFTTTSTSSTDQWRLLCVKYYSDYSCNMLHFTPSLLLYESSTSYTIKQVGASFTGESNIQTGNWNIYLVYVRCKKNIGQIQLSLKNNGRMGNVYIDSIQLYTTPPTFNYGEVSLYQGDFNVYSDLTGWSFEPGNSYNAPTYFWDTANQRLGVTFSNPSQEMKITCMNTLAVNSEGKEAVLSFDALVYKSNGQSNTVDCSGYLYADGFSWPFDIGANVISGDMPTNQTYTVYAVIRCDDDITKNRLPQIILKGNSESNVTVYIDNVRFRYNDGLVHATEN